MVEVNLKKDCPYCLQYFEKSIPNRWGSNWGRYFKQDTDLIYETNDLSIIAGLGALSEGYVLLLPKFHYLSIAALPETMVNNLILLKTKVRKFLKGEYGISVIFFEHGARGDETKGGSCIDHAHLHATPCNADFRSTLKKEFSEIEIHSLHELKTKISSHAPYILYEDGNEKMFVYQTPSKIPSQYIRRVWAEAIGRQKEWDWALYIGEAYIAKTLERFKRFP